MHGLGITHFARHARRKRRRLGDVTMHEPIRHHIESIAARSTPDSLRLTHQLHVGCWPGGGADHLEPAALEWVRRWRPETAPSTALMCGCAAGACSICN